MTLDVSTLAEVPLMHPIDRALSALDEAVALLVTSGKPSRFAEIRTLSSLAAKLARLRPAAGVDDVPFDEEGDGEFEPNRIGRFRPNDAVDLNREIIMIAQQMVKVYADTQKPKPVEFESRINATMELADLMRLRVQLVKEEQAVPDEVNVRIDQLLQRIGAPIHEPEHADHVEPAAATDPSISAVDVRRCSPDGAGGLDGDRVGEPLAQ
jgi:hypothetical protein